MLQENYVNQLTNTDESDLRDVFEIFITQASKLNVLDPASSEVVTAYGIANFVTSLLSLYRPLDVKIPILDVDQLQETLNTFRLKAVKLSLYEVEDSDRTLDNGTIPDLKFLLTEKRNMTDGDFQGTDVQVDKLEYLDGSERKDLLETLDAIDTRQGTDETLLRNFSEAMIGEDILHEDNSWTSWLGQKIMNLVSDSVFRTTKLYEVLTTGNRWTAVNGLVRKPLLHIDSLDRTEDNPADLIWAGHATREISNRFVYKGGKFKPLVTSLPIIGSGDMYDFDLNCVHENNFELRGSSSFFLGMGSHACKFRVKQVTEYGPDVSSTFPNDPLTIKHSSTLMELGPAQMVLNVPLIVQGKNVLAKAAQVGGHIQNDHHVFQQITKKTINNTHTHHHQEHNHTFLTTIRKTTRRYENTLQAGPEFHTHVTRRISNHSHRITVPSQFFLDTHIMYQNLRRISWVNVNGKPELLTKTEVEDLVAGRTTLENVNDAIATALQTYAKTTDLNEYLKTNDLNQKINDYVAASTLVTQAQLTSAISGLVDSDHDHEAAAHTHSGFATSQQLTDGLANKVSQADHDNHVGAVANALAQRVTSTDLTNSLSNYYAKNDAIWGTLVTTVSLANTLENSGYQTQSQVFSILSDVHANHLTTNSEDVLFYSSTGNTSDVQAISFKKFGADQVIYSPTILAFNALVDRVAALEQTVVDLQDQINTQANQATAAINTVQQTTGSIWLLTQSALTRLSAAGL